MDRRLARSPIQPASRRRPATERADRDEVQARHWRTVSITVPAADGKMRFWRNTSVANLAAGKGATLPDGKLGYEWDSDLDNGVRPAACFACRRRRSR